MTSGRLTAALHICFVCTGNICRSPMAAAVSKRHLEAAGLGRHVLVSSAGIKGWNVGGRADRRARVALRSRGYDPDHRAAQVSQWHLSADYLLAMTARQHRQLRTMASAGSEGLMFRTLRAEGDGSADVSDPYEGDAAGFEVTLDIIEHTMPRLLRLVARRLREQKCEL